MVTMQVMMTPLGVGVGVAVKGAGVVAAAQRNLRFGRTGLAIGRGQTAGSVGRGGAFTTSLNSAACLGAGVLSCELAIGAGSHYMARTGARVL